ncbi:MAG: alpha/beta hydrolase [Magnetococcales bacterium]|nr:alpha/beta hydrolase [Magnetococcales bacterium]
MKPELIWVHGWALGPGLWRRVLRLLPGFNNQLVDLGFFSRGTPLVAPTTPWVGIGHSLGFLWLLEQCQRGTLPMERCLGLVSINGFARFSRAPDLASAVHPRILRAMAARCRDEPEALLQDFRQKAGMPADLGPVPLVGLDRERLLEGLRWLEGWDRRAWLARWDRPLLVLAGGADAIVSADHTRALFADHPVADRHWLAAGGHMLPLTHPAWCGEHLRVFLERGLASSGMEAGAG